ncbi:MAG: outer membrane protein assembly factor BamA [Granulosicoccaceae bacterium]|jgi:outer membrane protein insertion porin family
MKKQICVLALLMLAWTTAAWSIDSFVVRDIRVEGLQRISAGTVFNYLPIKIGEQIDDQRSAEVIRALFKSGFFQDVRLERDGNVLIVFVAERPSIAQIDFSGNKSLEIEELREGLKTIGFAEGRVYDKSLLDKVEQELRRIYFSQGKYGVKIDKTITPLERNRVAITLDISEGVAARIHQINIVGNTTYADKDLLEEFELTTPTLFSFYTGTDQYSRQKLAADLERLRSFYLNRGYINFNVDSTQVTITPDRKDIYITINITEGERYAINKVKLAGEIVVPQEELFNLVEIRQGDHFSRRKATETSNAITQRLGNDGYAFANVNVVPEVDEKTKSVDITFFIDPGRRAYVRRINFAGNLRTRDEVLRREMRQFESAWISTENVERSKQRLDRLGYFEEVSVETPAVPGTTDQVDVNFKVKERASGNLLAGVGFSDSQGLVFNASVSQDNFLGSGKRVVVGFDNSEVNTVYRFAYVNPYYTEDGVSRGFNFLYRETDAEEANIARYTSDVARLGMSFGIPLTEYNSAGFSINYQKITINTSVNTPVSFTNYLADNDSSFDVTIDPGADGASGTADDFPSVGDSASFNIFALNGSYSQDTRNRRIFPERGTLHSITAEFAIPGSDLTYYKLDYRHERYHPLSRDLTLGLKGQFGYGDGYGDTGDLPFFENFLAGGGRSIRGFEDNTLGPKDPRTGDPLGGNVKLAGSAELIFPVPWVKDKNAWRFTGFVDAGNVYGSDEDLDLAELRYSTGVGVTWLSPFGALTFSVAAPFNEQEGDETKSFQFNFGSSF